MKLHISVGGPSDGIEVLTSVNGLIQDAVAQWDAVSTLWVLIAAFLVFFMQAGFGMVEAGMIRTKNAGNVLMKNVLDFCFASLGFFIFGIQENASHMMLLQSRFSLDGQVYYSPQANFQCHRGSRCCKLHTIKYGNVTHFNTKCGSVMVNCSANTQTFNVHIHWVQASFDTRRIPLSSVF